MNEEYLKKSEEARKELKRKVRHEMKPFIRKKKKPTKYILSDEQRDLLNKAGRYYKQKIRIR
jgi:hypothetical protein